MVASSCKPSPKAASSSSEIQYTPTNLPKMKTAFRNTIRLCYAYQGVRELQKKQIVCEKEVGV